MVRYFLVRRDLTWPIRRISCAEDKEATLPDHSKGRDQADAQSKKAQKAAHDAKEGRAHSGVPEARALREKTARLRALRLAKEATNPPAPAKKPARSKKTLAS